MWNPYSDDENDASTGMPLKSLGLPLRKNMPDDEDLSGQPSFSMPTPSGMGSAPEPPAAVSMGRLRVREPLPSSAPMMGDDTPPDLIGAYGRNIAARNATTPIPEPPAPGIGDRMTQPFGAPLGETTPPNAKPVDVPFDPAATARAQIGPQPKRGIGGTIKDTLLGLATGGVGGAVLGGIKGGDLRYAAKVNQRAGELQRAHENQIQQEQQDRLVANEILNKQNIQSEIANRTSETQHRQSLEDAGQWDPLPPQLMPDGSYRYAERNRKTGEVRAPKDETGNYIKLTGPVGRGAAAKPVMPGNVQSKSYQDRASELRRSLPVDEQGNAIDNKTGRPLSNFEIDTLIRDQLEKEKYTPFAKTPEDALQPQGAQPPQAPAASSAMPAHSQAPAAKQPKSVQSDQQKKIQEMEQILGPNHPLVQKMKEAAGQRGATPPANQRLPLNSFNPDAETRRLWEQTEGR